MPNKKRYTKLDGEVASDKMMLSAKPHNNCVDHVDTSGHMAIKKHISISTRTRGRARQDLNFEKGFVGKERGNFFHGGLQFYKNIKLKSEIFNDEKSLNKDICLCLN